MIQVVLSRIKLLAFLPFLCYNQSVWFLNSR